MAKKYFFSNNFEADINHSGQNHKILKYFLKLIIKKKVFYNYEISYTFAAKQIKSIMNKSYINYNDKKCVKNKYKFLKK
jgi:hypothetical protein